MLRPFGTLSAKQGRSSLLFMLKSNKNLEPVSLWVPNLRNRGKGNKVSLSNPFPTMPETAGRKAEKMTFRYSFQTSADEERDTGFPFPNPSPQTRKGIEKSGAVRLHYSKILLKVYFAQSVLGLNQELFFCALFLID